MSSYTLAITAPTTVPTSDPLVREFDRALQALHTHTPLSFFHWDQRVSPTNVYDYVIRAVDARQFTQVYTYDATPEQPKISTGGQAWSLVEIDLHRAVRATLLLIVGKYAVTSLRATFA